MGCLVGGRVTMHHLPSKGNYDIALAWRVLRLTLRVRPDILQTWLLQMDIVGGLVAMATGVSLIVSERSSAAAYQPSWKSRARVLVGSHAARIVANSRGGADYWNSYVPAKRIHVVRNCVLPVDAALQQPADYPASTETGHQLVLFAGRFSYEKNIPRLVEALIALAQQRSEVTIVAFGEGPERKWAERRIADAGLASQIRVKDYTSQLANWLSRAAVCVSVSNFEGHPNVVMEAAAAGCPLVLSDIAAHRELFDETSAFWAPAGSTVCIIKAMLAALDNPAQARERARRARDIANQFDLASVASAYKSIYESVADRPIVQLTS
jgi:glycosyltransferase involved in cell wall biosynthesis